MNEKIAIEVKKISKRYRIGLKEEFNDTLMANAVSIIKSPFENYKRLRGLHRFNESGDKEDIIWAVKDISFNVKAGEVLGVVGSNGAGKSTLSAVIAGREEYEVTGGTIEFEGKDIMEMAPEERAHLGIFLSFQYPVEIPGVYVPSLYEVDENSVSIKPKSPKTQARVNTTTSRIRASSRKQ